MKRGFALVEIVIVFGFLITLFGLVFATSLNFRSSTQINTALNTLITDIKNQQVKAMTGDTGGSGAIDSYGVYFAPDKYILFHGASYSGSNPSNFEINMEDNMQILTTLNDNTLLFSPNSGEVTNFSLAADSVTLNDSVNNISKTIKLNKYGAVIEEL